MLALLRLCLQSLLYYLRGATDLLECHLSLLRAKLCCRCFATVDCRGILNMIGRGTAFAVPLFRFLALFQIWPTFFCIFSTFWHLLTFKRFLFGQLPASSASQYLSEERHLVMVAESWHHRTMKQKPRHFIKDPIARARFWNTHVEGFAMSGRTISAYCEDYGISQNTLRDWCRKYSVCPAS